MAAGDRDRSASKDETTQHIMRKKTIDPEAVLFIGLAMLLNGEVIYSAITGKVPPMLDFDKWFDARHSLPLGYWIFIVPFAILTMFADCYLLFRVWHFFGPTRNRTQRVCMIDYSSMRNKSTTNRGLPKTKTAAEPTDAASASRGP